MLMLSEYIIPPATLPSFHSPPLSLPTSHFTLIPVFLLPSPLLPSLFPILPLLLLPVSVLPSAQLFPIPPVTRR